jgi:hypothetical protein
MSVSVLDEEVSVNFCQASVEDNDVCFDLNLHPTAERQRRRSALLTLTVSPISAKHDLLYPINRDLGCRPPWLASAAAFSVL